MHFTISIMVKRDRRHVSLHMLPAIRPVALRTVRNVPVLASEHETLNLRLPCSPNLVHIMPAIGRNPDERHNTPVNPTASPQSNITVFSKNPVDEAKR